MIAGDGHRAPAEAADGHRVAAGIGVVAPGEMGDGAAEPMKASIPADGFRMTAGFMVPSIGNRSGRDAGGRAARRNSAE